MTDPPAPLVPAEIMAQMLEQLAPIREATIGYRTQLLADGFSPKVAEEMASDLHGHLVAACFGVRR